MEGNEHKVVLACMISGTVFSILASASFSILWAVNWRPWRIYRFLLNLLLFELQFDVLASKLLSRNSVFSSV